VPVNDFTPYLNSFDGLAPFDGYVEKGFLIDFVGQRTDANFRTIWGVDPETSGGRDMQTKLPDLSGGEAWFEYFNWVAAAKEARSAMLDVAAEMLEVSAADLETDGKGNIHVAGVEEKSVSVAETVQAGTFQFGKTIAGRGLFLVPKSPQDPETGESDPHSTQAHACTVAEVEVDTESGEVEVLSLKSAYEIGRQINPELVKGQIVGGAWMAIGHTLCETTAPYYPTTEHAPLDFLNYGMTGVAEMPEVECELLEFPSPSGPFGAKGVGEMVANSPIPAIVNAINNALDLDISDIPVTPEVILRALDAQAAGAD